MTRKQFEICVAHRIYVLAESETGERFIVDTNYIPRFNKDFVLCYFTTSPNVNIKAYLSSKNSAEFNVIRLNYLKPIALLPIGQSTNVKYIKKAYFNFR